MPLYEYRCKKCGARVEKIQAFSDPPLEKCEACGGKLERLISAPAIRFKGSGFYATDYARKTSSAETSTGGTGNNSSGDGSKKSPEAAPVAKSSESKSDKK